MKNRTKTQSRWVFEKGHAPTGRTWASNIHSFFPTSPLRSFVQCHARKRGEHGARFFPLVSLSNLIYRVTIHLVQNLQLPVCLGSLAATLQWLTEDILPNLPHKITAIDCRILRFQVPNLELPIVFMTCRAKFYVNGQARHWGLGRKGECKSVP